MFQPDMIPPHAETFSFSDATHLSPVRAFVHTRARRFGLDDERAGRLALAVSELVTNALQHAAGGGTVRIWADRDDVTCDVTDSGPMRAFGRSMPPPTAIRGRGLALVERLCDEVTAIDGTDCTIIRLRFATTPGR